MNEKPSKYNSFMKQNSCKMYNIRILEAYSVVQNSNNILSNYFKIACVNIAYKNHSQSEVCGKIKSKPKIFFFIFKSIISMTGNSQPKSSKLWEP